MRNFRVMNGGNGADDKEMEYVFILDSATVGAIIPSHLVCFFIIKDGKVRIRTEYAEYPSSMTSDELDEMTLPGFIRCRRDYVVNMEFVAFYDEAESELIMEDDERIPVSEEYKEMVARSFADK